MKLETGMVWETDKETFSNTILITAVSPDAVKAVFHAKGMSDSIQQTLCLENFIQLLSDGEYLLRPTGMSGPIIKPEPVLKLSKTEDTGKKYLRTIRSKWQRGADGKLLTIDVDVYCVIDAYGPFSAAMNHAIKKVLCPGQRGSKDKITDLKEAIVSIQHEIDSEIEIAPPEQVKPNGPKDRKKEMAINVPLQLIIVAQKQGWEHIEVVERAVVENCHEFVTYQLEKGHGLRKQRTTIECCQFCGVLVDDYKSDPKQCSKVNEP